MPFKNPNLLPRQIPVLALAVLCAGFTPAMGNDLAGFWKLTDESIEMITEFSLANQTSAAGDKQSAKEIGEYYRNQVREFLSLDDDTVRLRLIHFEQDGDPYPEYYRDYEMFFSQTADGGFSLARGEKEVFSGEVKDGRLHLKDAGSGKMLYLTRLPAKDAPEITDEAIAPAKLDRSPKARKMTTPEYPPYLKAQGIEGSVEIEFMVNTDGTTSEVHVVSSTHPGFESAAIEAILASTFRPGQVKGKPVRTRVKIPITFR